MSNQLSGWDSDVEDESKRQNDHQIRADENHPQDDPRVEEEVSAPQGDEQADEPEEPERKTRSKRKASKKKKKGIMLTDKELLIQKIMGFSLHPRFKERVTAKYDNLTYSFLDSLNDDQLMDIFKEIDLITSPGYNQNLSVMVYGMATAMEIKARPKLDDLVKNMEKDDILNDSIAKVEIDYINWTVFRSEVQLGIDLLKNVIKAYRQNANKPLGANLNVPRLEHKPPLINPTNSLPIPLQSQSQPQVAPSQGFTNQLHSSALQPQISSTNPLDRKIKLTAPDGSLIDMIF